MIIVKREKLEEKTRMTFNPLLPLLTNGAEFLFTVAAVIICFAIYYKTREVYELTNHKGIKYFREAFLYFGLSYLIRFIATANFLSSIALEYSIVPKAFIPILILLLGYFSTIGTINLIFSADVWKKFDNTNLLIAGHTLALLLSVISFLSNSYLILLYLQTLLLIFAVILTTLAKKGKKITQSRILYLLVLALWLINLWSLDLLGPFTWETQIAFKITSLIVFIVIYYRVTKWIE